MVAELLGHARLETTRRYSLPPDKDKEDARTSARVSAIRIRTGSGPFFCSFCPACNLKPI